MALGSPTSHTSAWLETFPQTRRRSMNFNPILMLLLNFFFFFFNESRTSDGQKPQRGPLTIQFPSNKINKWTHLRVQQIDSGTAVKMMIDIVIAPSLTTTNQGFGSCVFVFFLFHKSKIPSINRRKETDLDHMMYRKNLVGSAWRWINFKSDFLFLIFLFSF